jgi:hypothetical protein
MSKTFSDIPDQAAVMLDANIVSMLWCRRPTFMIHARACSNVGHAAN